MNSMMLIAAIHITPRTSEQTVLAMALDACASGRSNDGRMHGACGQHHAVSRLELEAPLLAFEHETDRSVDAVKDLLVAVAVRRVTVAGPVGPRVAACRLGLQP